MYSFSAVSKTYLSEAVDKDYSIDEHMCHRAPHAEGAHPPQRGKECTGQERRRAHQDPTGERETLEAGATSTSQAAGYTPLDQVSTQKHIQDARHEQFYQL